MLDTISLLFDYTGSLSPADMAYNYHGAMQYPPAPQYTTPFKPGANATTTTVHGHNSTSSYNPVPGASHADPSIARLSSRGATLKHRIRLFKAISRLLATVLSLATFLPLAMTLVKFFETRNETLTVNGEERTAWAAGTITWYAYLYFGVATVSLVLNSAILIAYCRSVKRANTVADVADWWSYLQYAVEVLVWIASVAIYRYGKEPNDEGKFKDLWGWTCSSAAQDIQDQVTNVDYDMYCDVQVSSSMFLTLPGDANGHVDRFFLHWCTQRGRGDPECRPLFLRLGENAIEEELAEGEPDDGAASLLSSCV